MRLDATGTPLVQKLLGSDTVRVEEIVPTDDGGFLVRAALLISSNDSITMVAKLSAAFAVLWQKTVGDTLTRYYDLVPLADGGALLTGTIYSNQTFTSSQMVTRLDNAGNLIWRRDFSFPGSFNLAANALADGSFVLVGTVNAGGDNYNAYVLKLDASGVRQWDVELDAGGGDSLLAVAQVAGGALVASGLTDVTAVGKTDVLLVRLDAAGAVTAKKTLGGSLWETGTALVGNDGKLYLVGGTFSYGEGAWDAWLSELDPATLEPLWSRVIGSPVDDFIGFLPDSTGGGFFGSGTSKAGGGQLDIFVGKLAAGADALTWQRLVGAGRDEAGGAVRLPDANVLVTGSSESFAAAAAAAALPAVPQDDALAVKLDANGALAGCDLVQTPSLVVAAFTPTAGTPTVTATTLAPPASSPVEVTGAATLTVSNGALTPRDACTAPELLAADAVADPRFGAAPLAVGFTGGAANGQPPYTYSWDFGDGSPTSTLQSPSHNYLAEGAYTATLTVTDAAATTATDSVTITVDDSGCALQCLASVPTAGPAGEDLIHSGGYSAVGCAGQPVYAWDFGDGATAATKDALHAYAAAGTYQWSLTVTLDGEQCTTGGSITISGVQEISVLVGGAPLSDGQAAVVGFGTVGQGQPGSSRTFIVRNDGAAILSLGAVTAPAGFTVTEPLVGPLQPGSSDTLTVRLDSAVLGAKSGQLVINSNDPDEQPFNVPLTGTVAAPLSLPRRFDFGTATSPLAAGWLRATNTTTYGAAQGYGWTSGTIQTRDRGAGGDLNRDFAFSTLATFEVDVAYGVWDVTVTLGDATAVHEQMGVLLEGVGIDDITTRVNEFITCSYRVTVADGRLTLTIDDLGGADPNVVITALALAPQIGEGKFDFGTASSPVEDGYTRVEPGTAYSAASGFGWLSGTRDARDRGIGGSLDRDFVFSPLATFAVDVPPGVWDVTMTLGDATTAHDQMGVYLEGELAWQLSTTPGPGGSVALSRVAVLDGQLTVLLDDLGGADPNVALCGLTIAPAARNRFDFGTATSPVGLGHTRVTEATAYTPQLEYGWISGTRTARDRGTGTGVTRDFVFTPLAEFVVDVPAGRYDVTIVLGDATAAHEQMGVFLEGAQVDSVTTAVNQFVTRAYRVAVGDGQLRLKLDDLGGADANVVINALTVAPAAILKLDFGTASSPVAADYVRVTEATAYAAVPGYGWLSGTRQSRDRATSDPLTRDLVFSALTTFAADVPRGSHKVTVRLGDASAAHEQMGVYFEGDLYDSLTAAAGEFVVRTTNIDVTDGQLTLLLDDLGGGDANVVINALEVR